MIALLLTLALAAEPCPTSVKVVNLTALDVDGAWVKVAKPRDRLRMEDLLHRCRPGSVDSFRRWRMARQNTTLTAVVGVTIFWPALVGTAVFGVQAADHRAAFERDVRRDDGGER
jgi:hypothetical protein